MKIRITDNRVEGKGWDYAAAKMSCCQMTGYTDSVELCSM